MSSPIISEVTSNSFSMTAIDPATEDVQHRLYVSTDWHKGATVRTTHINGEYLDWDSRVSWEFDDVFQAINFANAMLASKEIAFPYN